MGDVTFQPRLLASKLEFLSSQLEHGWEDQTSGSAADPPGGSGEHLAPLGLSFLVCDMRSVTKVTGRIQGGVYSVSHTRSLITIRINPLPLPPQTVSNHPRHASGPCLTPHHLGSSSVKNPTTVRDWFENPIAIDEFIQDEKGGCTSQVLYPPSGGAEGSCISTDTPQGDCVGITMSWHQWTRVVFTKGRNQTL